MSYTPPTGHMDDDESLEYDIREALAELDRRLTKIEEAIDAFREKFDD